MKYGGSKLQRHARSSARRRGAYPEANLLTQGMSQEYCIEK
jgi:hypothetical protein